MKPRWMCALFCAIFISAGSAQTVTPLQKSGQVAVLLFLSTDCPVSNKYAPEIQRLQKEFAGADVRFHLVYPNRADGPDAISAHIRQYGYTGFEHLDRGDPLARRAGATITPEAAVFDNTGHLVYHGRIDDRFVEVLTERRAPTTHDLEHAIAAVLAGKPVDPAATQAVGCFIADF